ncbi:aldehyde dehydrogenase family protein [Noviherbaspirillum saxi]|uniref:aldehyde dehydrogenase family protein n=1 Tax=Noviherbaspirillum saxi TaxID=2320863 RepID=UPI0018F4F016|nr:aldehyde dehydrogenase family protein [Noviherbaspirillum saxi]
MDIDAKEIERIVRSVLKESGKVPAAAGNSSGKLAQGVFASLDDAVVEADRARRAIRKVSERITAVEAMRKAGQQYAKELAEMAVAETGMGRVDDKTAKNIAQAKLTPGVECLQARALTGDHGLTLIENAAWGVIASVTPSTNPAATVINNAISMIAAGNSVVFAPHPAAKKVSQRAITLLNAAIVAAGGPDNLLTTVAEPDIATAQRLFRYPGINLLTVTGGEAVIHEARKHTDKRLIAAGAGNPPVVVDETADIPRAARDIVWGASFDNNIICVDEKEIVVVDQVCDKLKAEMKKHKAVELTAAQARQLQDVLLSNIGADGKGTVSRKWVGRDAAKIAAAIGVTVPEDTRLLFVETERDHPFAVTELMMPVIPVIRAANADEAIDIAVALEGGCKHTAAMHSRDLDNLDRMANEINTSIFVKNGPCLAGLGFGGEGWTTMTISTPTGEGVTSAATFVRLRRCVLVDNFRII